MTKQRAKCPSGCDFMTFIHYNETFDAFWCKQCKVWIEDKCDVINCSMCSKRPELPPIEEE